MQDINSIEWQGRTKDDLEFIGMFGKFAKGKMSSTYKAVFLKCLLDLRHYDKGAKTKQASKKEWVRISNGEIVLDLNFVATRFLKYYWDMEYGFGFKQTSDRHDTRIQTIIKGLKHKYPKPPTRAQLASNNNFNVRKNVIDEAMKPEVMKHLTKIDMPDLFSHEKGSTFIILDSKIMGFFNRHYNAVSTIINYKLVTELEKYNKVVPRIASKIDFDKRVRTMIDEEMKKFVMLEYEKERRTKLCFYCQKRKISHFDHVVPFKFVYSHDVYNIVPSCQKCNCVKHDKLPECSYFTRVIDRNRVLGQLTGECFQDGVELSTGKKFKKAISNMVEYRKDQYKILYDSYEATYPDKPKFSPDLIAN